MIRYAVLILIATPLLAQEAPPAGGCAGDTCPITSVLPNTPEASMPSTQPATRPPLDLQQPTTVETATFGLG